MNDNFINKTNPKRNSVLSFLITLIVDFIVYAGKFGVEYFMGKALDIWLSNNSSIFGLGIIFIRENFALSFFLLTVFSFLLFLAILMYVDWKKSNEKERVKVMEKSEYPSKKFVAKNGSVSGETISDVNITNNNYPDIDKKKEK